jgi:serine/threonine protein kinase
MPNTPNTLDPGSFARGDLPAGYVLGKCRIEKLLGRGGMGAVYLARHQTLDTPVAVKVMPPDVAARSPDYAERFLREAKVAAQLKHPNVLAVMDADRDLATGLTYIVQEYMDGGSVGDKLRKGPLPEAKANAVLIAMLKALSLAAKKSIVHRDIKPDNILLSKDGRVKLADLGLAKRTDESGGVTQDTSAFGTPHYMSPEQFQDARSVDTRSDLYSLGATYYHLLTGRPPFPGTQIYEVLQKVMSSPVPDPRDKVPAVSERAARVCVKMMMKTPRLRYQTPDEVLEDLERGGPGLELETAPPAPSVFAPPPGLPLAQQPTMVMNPPGVPQSGPARKIPPIKPSWIVAGCAILVLGLAVRMTVKSGEAIPDRPLTPIPDGGGGALDPSGGAAPPVDPGKKDPVPVKPPDPPPIERRDPPVKPPDPTAGAFTLHDGILLCLTFEPETAVEQDGRSGYRDLSGFLVREQRVMVNSVGALPAAGRVGSGVRFASDEQYLSAPPYVARSIAAWVNADSLARPGWFYDGGGDERLNGFLIGLARPGHFGWPLESEAAAVGFWQVDALVPAEGIDRGWHHLVVSWDGAKTLRIAVDGKLLDGLVHDRRGVAPKPGPQPLTLPGSPQPRSDTTIIGRTHVSNNPGLAGFRGTLDELAVWGRELTEAEMKALFGYAGRNESYCERIQEYLEEK